MKNNNSAKDFEYIAHTADIKVRVYGNTLPEFFRHAVQAMFQVIKPRIPGCTEVNERIICDKLPIQHNVSVSSIDKESVLVDFLSEALYLSDVHNEAYLDATIHDVSDTSINATLHGIPVDGFEVVEIKAVTYHELAITHYNGVWQADIVFDI